MELKDCFREDFINWLVCSNHPVVRSYMTNQSKNSLDINIVEESLQEILDVLLREPLADYFWYGYPEYGSKLSYTIPSYKGVMVPGDALRVDKEKIKVFLRDIKIENILN